MYWLHPGLCAGHLANQLSLNSTSRIFLMFLSRVCKAIYFYKTLNNFLIFQIFIHLPLLVKKLSGVGVMKISQFRRRLRFLHPVDFTNEQN